MDITFLRKWMKIGVTISDIGAHADPGARLLMAERYGLVRYWREKKAYPVASDDCGTLYQIDGDPVQKLVHVVNSTPEPDGRRRDYFLRVPSTVTTAREAVAWTFGLRSDEYAPLFQT